MSLAVKYRPAEFADVSSQKAVVRILEQQIKTGTFSNTMMFIGASGCGKTTLARIFANKINHGRGEPIELDAASNSGVENVRQLCDQANERALDAEYKVYIIDECHCLSTSAWNSFLKTIEEPPKYTVFIFCTTEQHKVPATIMNRCQTFTISKISDDLIKERLKYICSMESFSYTDGAIDYIVKLAEGSMRQAISFLDKCKDYSTNIDITNVRACLGDYSYDLFFRLTDLIVDNNKLEVCQLIDYVYFQGADLKLFINEYLNFLLQVNKFILLNDMSIVTIPAYYEKKLRYTVGIENNRSYFSRLLDRVLDLKVAIKNDSDVKTTITVYLIGGDHNGD